MGSFGCGKFGGQLQHLLIRLKDLDSGVAGNLGKVGAKAGELIRSNIHHAIRCWRLVVAGDRGVVCAHGEFVDCFGGQGAGFGGYASPGFANQTALPAAFRVQ